MTATLPILATRRVNCISVLSLYMRLNVKELSGKMRARRCDAHARPPGRSTVIRLSRHPAFPLDLPLVCFPHDWLDKTIQASLLSLCVVTHTLCTHMFTVHTLQVESLHFPPLGSEDADVMIADSKGEENLLNSVL